MIRVMIIVQDKTKASQNTADQGLPGRKSYAGEEISRIFFFFFFPLKF